MSKRDDALAVALKEVGVKESPAGSNWGPRVSEYLKSAGLTVPAPWCLAFVHWCFAQVGVDLAGHGLVQAFDDWAKANGDLVDRPLEGDIICYDWNNDHWDDHTGIIVKVLALRWKGKAFAGWVKTVEGNTAVGNDSNGGEVMIRYRWIVGFGAKYARVKG